MPATTSPTMISDLVASISRIYDQNPELVETVHELTRDRLDQGPHGTFEDGWTHVADHMREIFPALMADERIIPVHEALVNAYSRMPATEETRLRQSPDGNSIGIAVAVGVGIGIIVAGVIVGYCLSSGPDPAPGESVPAHC